MGGDSFSIVLHINTLLELLFLSVFSQSKCDGIHCLILDLSALSYCASRRQPIKLCQNRPVCRLLCGPYQLGAEAMYASVLFSKPPDRDKNNCFNWKNSGVAGLPLAQAICDFGVFSLPAC